MVKMTMGQEDRFNLKFFFLQCLIKEAPLICRVKKYDFSAVLPVYIVTVGLTDTKCQTLYLQISNTFPFFL